MSRKPAHLEMIGGKSPRQRMWEAIRDTAIGGNPENGGFTATDIARACKIEAPAVSEYLRALHLGGYLGRHDLAHRGEPARY